MLVWRDSNVLSKLKLACHLANVAARDTTHHGFDLRVSTTELSKSKPNTFSINFPPFSARETGPKGPRGVRTGRWPGGEVVLPSYLKERTAPPRTQRSETNTLIVLPHCQSAERTDSSPPTGPVGERIVFFDSDPKLIVFCLS